MLTLFWDLDSKESRGKYCLFRLKSWKKIPAGILPAGRKKEKRRIS